MFPIGMHEMLAEGALNFPTAPIPSGAQKWKGAFLSVVICQAILCFFRYVIFVSTFFFDASLIDNKFYLKRFL